MGFRSGVKPYVTKVKLNSIYFYFRTRLISSTHQSSHKTAIIKKDETEKKKEVFYKTIVGSKLLPLVY